MKYPNLSAKELSEDNYSLLANVPYIKLLAGMGASSVATAWDMLAPHLKEHEKMDVGIAYHLGIMQGKHNERQRRNEGSQGL